MPKILITGVAGFIGSNLCRRLLDAGHQVSCLDDLSTGKYHNISNLEDDTNFEYVKVCLTSTYWWPDFSTNQ